MRYTTCISDDNYCWTFSNYIETPLVQYKDHPPASSKRGNMRLKGYPMSIKGERVGLMMWESCIKVLPSLKE